jgi:hypothetical protein
MPPQTPGLAFILRALELQVVDAKYVMNKLTGGKKDAKKMKKTIDIFPEKGEDVPDAYQKHSRKKDGKNH